VLFEGGRDRGLAAPPGNEVLEGAHLPRHVHGICELCKSPRPRVRPQTLWRERN
jgi:hypothetical protein